MSCLLKGAPPTSVDRARRKIYILQLAVSEISENTRIDLTLSCSMLQLEPAAELMLPSIFDLPLYRGRWDIVVLPVSIQFASTASRSFSEFSPDKVLIQGNLFVFEVTG